MGCNSACGLSGSCGTSGGGGCLTGGGSCGAGGCGSGGAWDGTLKEVAGVTFHNTAKTYYYDSTGLALALSEMVIVDGDHGEQFATVVQPTGTSRKFATVTSLKRVLRRASDRDIATDRENRRRENNALDFCQTRIRQRRLDMKLVYTEETFDRKKLTFYFTSEGRVDFRELVKELAQQFRSRIEMRQIGPRDEAKALGGYGDCGRPLCCTTFLKEFAPISIRMARRQGLSLNPSKISGRCGRLKCCLKYEDTGEDLPGRVRDDAPDAASGPEVAGGPGAVGPDASGAASG